MMTSPSPDTAATPGGGTVAGAPRRWLRLEGGVALAGALLAYTTTHQAWWLIPLTLLAPDLSALGYLRDNRLGARLYNAAHITPLPAAAIALGWWQHAPLVCALGLIWIAHIGTDRLLGYGLKYNDDPQHTHLGQKGGKAGKSAVRTPRAAAEELPL